MPFIPGLTEPSPPTLPSFVAYGRQAVPQAFYTPGPAAEAMTQPRAGLRDADGNVWHPRTSPELAARLAAGMRGLGAAPSTWGYVGVAAAVAVIGAGVLATVYAETQRPKRAPSRRARTAAARRRRRRTRRS